MNRHVSALWGRRASALAVVLLCAVALGGCDKLKARDRLNKGVASYKNAQYDQAIEYFKQAKELDPGLLNARLYLATAYASQYIPGAPSEENVRKGNEAIAEFKEILANDANNLNAIDGIGSILFQMSGAPFSPEKFEESKSYHQKHAQLKPEDPEPYYWVGVIDWTLAFRANSEIRVEYNRENVKKQIKDTDPLPAKAREAYAAKYAGVVDEGVKALQQAISVKPDYEDAMAYLNLLYRRRADMVESAEERAGLLKQADDLVDKVKEIKQKKMEAPPQPS